jgi:ADP-ribose pyrophosphatase
MEKRMDSTKPQLSWELIESREDRKYNLFSINVHRSKSPRTGNIHEFQVVNTPDWVTVIPVTADNKIILVKQFRHGSGELSLEPPGGLVKQGQTAEQSAREELEEETGYIAEKFELLGELDPFPALFNNKFFVYCAKDARPDGKLHPDETEEIETVLIPLKELREYIRSRKITCAVMIGALHLFLDKEGQNLKDPS